MKVSCLPAFNDNYLWILEENKQAWAVDPGDANVVMQYLHDKQLYLAGILITHHHADHIGGVAKLLKAYPEAADQVYGPQLNKKTFTSIPLTGGETITVAGQIVSVIATPGHTLNHLVYYFPQPQPEPILFSGDTLFAAGCGRLFEGSPQQMRHSLKSLAKLPPHTRVYCAHEYTLANLAFASAVEPDNEFIKQRIQRCQALREKSQATVPFSLQEEHDTNPFFRVEQTSVQKAARQFANKAPDDDDECFAMIRQWKNIF